VKRGKTDAADAEAICEAVIRPTMRFVPVKSAERQAGLLDHKAREFLVRQRTQIVNAIRAHLSEFGIVIAKGIHNIDRLLATAEKAPEAARPALAMLADQLRDTHDRIAIVTARVESAQAGDPLARRLASVPGIGAITASALAATTPDVEVFRTGRDYAAWLGARSVSRTDRVPARATEGAFLRRQGAARRDLESGQSLSPSAALSRSDVAQ
jgi:transposase